MLATLRERGYHLGVFSDYPATEKLKALGVRDYFTTVVSSQDNEVRGFKPNTTGFGIAVSRLGLLPGEVLYVGDRLDVDGRGAKGAGIAAAILGKGKADTDDTLHVIGSLADLLSMLPGNYKEENQHT